MTHLMNRPCLIRRKTPGTTTDEYGTPTTETVEVRTVCELQPATSTRRDGEPSSHLDLTDSDWLLLLPAGTEIDSPDQVEVEGLTYEVSTAPWSARNPWTQEPSHVEVGLRRTA